MGDSSYNEDIPSNLSTTLAPVPKSIHKMSDSDIKLANKLNKDSHNRHHHFNHHHHRRYSAYEDKPHRNLLYNRHNHFHHHHHHFESRPEPTIIKRRNSSFASTLSPWFRRNSLLSPSMIQLEDLSVYECPTFFNDSSSSSYNIISLKECQGFIFNQDLFASPYQQLRAIANEKKYRAISFNHGLSPLSSNSSRSSSNSCISLNQRRHTSYIESRPSFNHSIADLSSAIDDEDDEDEEIEITTAATKNPQQAVVDEYDEYEDSHDTHYSDYGHTHANRMFRVHVTEILVNEDDDSIFPT